MRADLEGTVLAGSCAKAGGCVAEKSGKDRVSSWAKERGERLKRKGKGYEVSQRSFQSKR